MERKPTAAKTPDQDDTDYISPLAFCDHCGTDVPFLVHKTRKNGLMNGVRYYYRGKKANCRVCGSTIILPEIIAYNTRKLIAESRKEKYKEIEQKDDT